MKAHPERLALVQGWDSTRLTLRLWVTRPGMVVRPWVAGSLAVALALLVSTWAVAAASTPDATQLQFAGVTRAATLGDYGFVLFRNSLVLALHALACVA